MILLIESARRRAPQHDGELPRAPRQTTDRPRRPRARPIRVLPDKAIRAHTSLRRQTTTELDGPGDQSTHRRVEHVILSRQARSARSANPSLGIPLGARRPAQRAPLVSTWARPTCPTCAARRPNTLHPPWPIPSRSTGSTSARSSSNAVQRPGAAHRRPLRCPASAMRSS